MLIRVKTPLNNNERRLLNSKFVTMRYKTTYISGNKIDVHCKTVRPPIINLLILASEIATCCVGEMGHKNLTLIYGL